MPRKRILSLLGCLMCIVMIPAALAETTQWVADDLKVAVRSGPSTKHKILRFSESGTPMAILGVDEAEGYTQVRTPEGTEGWVLTEQLQDQRGARERLERSERRIDALKQENAHHQQEIAALNGTLAEARAQIQALEGQVEDTQRELANLRQVAAEPIQVAEENQRLQAALEEEQQAVRQLRAEVATLSDRSLKEWFLIGAGVALGSLFLGLIIPRIRWRRRGWDDFR